MSLEYLCTKSCNLMWRFPNRLIYAIALPFVVVWFPDPSYQFLFLGSYNFTHMLWVNPLHDYHADFIAGQYHQNTHIREKDTKWYLKLCLKLETLTFYPLSHVFILVCAWMSFIIVCSYIIVYFLFLFCIFHCSFFFHTVSSI